MQTRRAIMAQMAAAALVTGGPLAAQDRYDQAALLAFAPLGQITLVHYSDLFGLLWPHYLRPAAVSYGPERVPHLTGESLRIRYGIGGRTPMDAAMTSEGFDSLGQVYGPMGGLAYMATVVQAIRAVRPGALVLDGGGSDIPAVTEVLRPDAAPFDRNGQARPGHLVFEQGGAQIAVIALTEGQTEFDLATLQAQVDQFRAKGAAVVVLLSRLGFAADRALAGGISDVDVILSGQSGYALPEPEVIGGTHIIASGSQGRFVSRVDIDVAEGRMAGLRHGLIPIFSDLITPDAKAQAAYAKPPGKVVGNAGVTLHHQDSFGGTWAALIAAAMKEQTGARMALVPPLRSAPTVLAGQPITTRDIIHVTTGVKVESRKLTGAGIRELLESSAEAAFSSNPFARQSTRLMRAGGLAFSVAPQGKPGARISDLILEDTGTALTPDQSFEVAVLEESSGAPLSESLTRYITNRDRVAVAPSRVTVRG